jgi:hypothetical protein
MGRRSDSRGESIVNTDYDGLRVLDKQTAERVFAVKGSQYKTTSMCKKTNW